MLLLSPCVRCRCCRHCRVCCCCPQVRRKMEEENRKARRSARREYLENVRELVAFVKKRDKRVAKAQVRTTDSSGLLACLPACFAGNPQGLGVLLQLMRAQANSSQLHQPSSGRALLSGADGSQ